MALRQESGTGLYWLLGDHLGSTSTTDDADGVKVAELRYMPWGENRYTSGTTPTTFKYTGQRNEISLGGADGLYYYGARWYDPYLNRWISPDSIIPDLNNSQDWDRYAYSRNNPVKYIDPTGHWPDWLDSALDFAQGAAYQFANDMSGGAVDKIAASYAVCMDCNASEAYKEGQQAGRGASTVVSSAEIVLGAAGTGAALAAIPPTVGGGLVCTGATAGLCALPAGAAVTVEGGVAVAGVAVAGAGSATASYITANPINKHHPWPKYLGGPENQPLLTLPRDLHEKYHAGLDKIFSRYNGSLEWDELTAARQQEILTKLADYNMKFDRDYGTNTTQAFYEALVAAGIIK